MSVRCLSEDSHEPRGRHVVTVTYLGDSTYAGSTATVTDVVD